MTQIEFDPDNIDIQTINEQEYYILPKYIYEQLLDTLFTQELQNEIILSLGNQLVDWTDDTAATWTTANELNLHKDIVNEFVERNLESIFRGFDGYDKPLFSYEGWQKYEELYEEAVKSGRIIQGM